MGDRSLKLTPTSDHGNAGAVNGVLRKILINEGESAPLGATDRDSSASPMRTFISPQ